MMSHRQIVPACGALAVSGGTARAADEDALGALERQKGGRLGVFAVDVGSGRTLAHRADERFMLFSTSKGVLAAAVLADVEAGTEALNARVPYPAADLLPASPITRAHLDDGSLTVEALCLAVTHQSDNAAANLLLARRGGPGAALPYSPPMTKLLQATPPRLNQSCIRFGGRISSEISNFRE